MTTKPTRKPELARQRIKKQLDEGEAIVKAGQGEDSDARDVWIDLSQEVLVRALGSDHPQAKDFRNAGLWEMNARLGGRSPGEEGMRRRLSVLTSALAVVCLDIEDSVLELQGPPIKADTSPKSAEIFLVHGHDVALKAEVELFLERVTGRQPIVLRNQANGGLTLIEKFEKHGGKAGFAVILMTGDDAGGKAAAGAQALRPRARQNVVFEFGYFVGLVGRGRVAVLVDKGVEEPTDLSGIVYIPTTDWKIDLVRELELAKVPVDRQRM